MSLVKLANLLAVINIGLDDLNLGDVRLREVNDGVILPSKTNIKLLILLNDVIHSFFFYNEFSK